MKYLFNEMSKNNYELTAVSEPLNPEFSSAQPEQEPSWLIRHIWSSRARRIGRTGLRFSATARLPSAASAQRASHRQLLLSSEAERPFKSNLVRAGLFLALAAAACIAALVTISAILKHTFIPASQYFFQGYNGILKEGHIPFKDQCKITCLVQEMRSTFPWYVSEVFNIESQFETHICRTH